MAQSAVEPVDPFYSFGERVKHTPGRRDASIKTLDDARRKGNEQGVPVSQGKVVQKPNNQMKFKPRNGRNGPKTQGRRHDMPQASPNPHLARARDAQLQQLVVERAKQLK